MSAPSALVTGATGFLGARLVPALVATGWAVRATARRPRPAWMPGVVDYRAVDLTGGEDLRPLSQEITHVFHLAGASSSLSSTEEMHRSNVVATQRLVASLVGGDVQRFVHLSSTSVYGEEEQLDLPVREDVRPCPSRGYGKAKWQAEQAVWSAAASGLSVTVLRPVSVFGPANIKLLGSAILDVAIEHFAGRPILPVPAEVVEQRLVHIDDLVRACLHLAPRGDAAGRAFNIVFPEYPTSHQIVELLADIFAMTPEMSDDPQCGLSYEERQQQRAAMLSRGMHPDILLTKERFRLLGKANRNNRLSVEALLSTGFRFNDERLDDSIRTAVAWYAENRWILL